LANDKVYAEKVQAVLAARPDGKDPDALFRWIWSYSSACMDNRDYARAEHAARSLVALAPHYNLVHSNLSVVLGKQGKYQEALQEAEIASLLNPGDSLHPEAVACSWLYHLGRKQEAVDRFKAIPVPADARKARAYWGCKACFYASVGDPELLKPAIAMALQLDPEDRGFFERDVVFDAYRAEPWFIELVGRTLQ
jgi:tetratricopeptide (TPR) repeat protein